MRQNISLSANDLLACCGFLCGDGCDGGYPLQAWKYFVRKGVVTDEVYGFVLDLLDFRKITAFRYFGSLYTTQNDIVDPYSQLTNKIYSGSVTLTLITRDVPTLDVNLHIPPQSVTGSALNRIYSGVGPSILASMHT